MSEIVTLEQRNPQLLQAEIIPSPAELDALHPLTAEAHDKIIQYRQTGIDIISGRDPRMMAVVGPCSMDDNKVDGRYTTLEFAERIQEIAAKPEIAEQLFVVMRAPNAKPRTHNGPRGLEQTNLVAAHEIATKIANMGVPLASEVVGASQLARLAGNLSLAWVGARDNQSTTLRHLMSAYPELPVFVKNGGSGELEPALNAIMTIGDPQRNVELMMADGRMGYLPNSAGNPNTALLWRGGEDYKCPSVYEKGIIATAGTSHAYGVDLSHGGAVAHDPNNLKSAEGQKACLDHVVEMMLNNRLPKPPVMVMAEGYLLEGADTTGNTPGKSVTDPCLNIEDVGKMLVTLAETQAQLRV